MGGKTTPSPPQPGAGTARSVTWALPWRGWELAWPGVGVGVGVGVGEASSLGLCGSRRENAHLIFVPV